MPTKSTPKDDFFSDLGNTKPFLKLNFFGMAGTGKTYTSALVAIGLHKRIESKKPVIIFDTETSSKFLKGVFDEAKIPVLVKESRSLADLKETMRCCREGASDILFIDSISHIWENFLQSYMEKKNRTFLQFQDWGVIKPTWRREFSDPFVRDSYHCLMTGRAGYEYANEINEDTGKRELIKSGVKEKVEGETAYEPDILVYMEAIKEMQGTSVKRMIRQGTIIKDRSTILDGKCFENPNYDTFAPAIETILSNPTKQPTYAEVDAASLVKTEEDKREYFKQKDIALDRIKAYLDTIYPGSSAEMKKNKQEICNCAFGRTDVPITWLEIEDRSKDELNEAFEAMREFVKAKTELADEGKN